MNWKLTTIVIFCRDVKKMVEFYTGYFGFQTIGNLDESWTLLETGLCRIGFHKIGEEYSEIESSDSGEESNTKLIFETENDLAGFRLKLLKENVDLGEIIRYPGAKYVICDGRDPEGNVFQLQYHDRGGNCG